MRNAILSSKPNNAPLVRDRDRMVMDEGGVILKLQVCLDIQSVSGARNAIDERAQHLHRGALAVGYGLKAVAVILKSRFVNGPRSQQDGVSHLGRIQFLSPPYRSYWR